MKILGSVNMCRNLINNALIDPTNKNILSNLIFFMYEGKSFLLLSRSLITHGPLLSQRKLNEPVTIIKKPDGTVVKKKAPKVMVNLMQGNEFTVVSLDSAIQMAKSQGLNLIKVENSAKSTRETYRLVTDSDYVKPEQSGNGKQLKKIIVNSVIDDNSLGIKAKGAAKILLKKGEVMFIIKSGGKTSQNDLKNINDNFLNKLKENGVSVTAKKVVNSGNILKAELHLAISTDQLTTDESEKPSE